MAHLAKEDGCVLIPAFNEALRIGQIVREARAMGFAVLVVDDGSKDRTASEAKTAGAEVLTCLENQGKGAALKIGFERCLKNQCQALIAMDADGQHDPKTLEQFFEAIQKNPSALVIGSRMHNPHNMPLARRLTNQILSWVLSKIIHQSVPDSQCGYRALPSSLLQKMDLRSARFEIESEIILEAARHGFKIESIPIQSVYEGSKSQIHPVKDTFRLFRFLIHYLATRKMRKMDL